MKRNFFLLILMTTTYLCSAQAELKKQEVLLLDRLRLTNNDSVRMEILKDLVNLFYQKHYDKEAIPYALQLLEIRKRSAPAAVPGTFSFLGQAHLNCKRFDSAKFYWEKALQLKQEFRDTAFEVDLNRNVGLIYFNDFDFLKSRVYYTKALELSKNRNRPNDMSLSHLFLGRIAKYTSDIVLAERHFTEALKINKDNNFTGDVAVILTELSGLYVSKGQYSQATDYIMQAIKIAERIKDRQLLFTVYNDLGIIFTRTRQFDSALISFSRGERLVGNDKTLQAYIKGNIGTIYLGMKKYDSAKLYITKSISLSEETGMWQNLAFRLNNLGDVHLNEKNYKGALPLFHRSLILNQRVSDPDIEARNYTQLGKLYYDMATDSVVSKRPDSLQFFRSSTLLKRSAGYLNISITICKKLGKLDILQENYRILADVNHELKDHQQALDNLSMYILYRDSIFNIDAQSKQNKLIIAHEFEMKEEAIAKENELKRKTRLTVFIIITAAGLLIALLSIYYIRRIDKGKFELQLAGLRQEALNAQISDHFISNAMDSIQRFIQLNQNEKASEYSGKFRDLVRDVLINSGKQLITLQKDLEVLKNYTELEALRFAGRGLQYAILIDDDIDPECILVPPMLLQIQAENSIKHGFTKTEGGKLLVSVKKGEQNILVCRVEDDGGGRAASKIIAGETRRTSVGSTLARKIVNSMSKQYRYDIIDLRDINQQPCGTAVEYTLPFIQVN